MKPYAGLFMALIILSSMSCGEDEPEPTFEELIAKVDIVWDTDDSSIGRPPSEMDPVTCSLASGTYKHCYSLDSACAAGKMPTVCFDNNAEPVACKRGVESESRPGDYVISSSRKTISGRSAIYFDIMPNRPHIVCED